MSCKRGLTCWHWAKYVFRAWGQLKRGLEMLARCEMFFEGMGAVERGGLRCCHRVKYVSRAWGDLKRGSEVLALGEVCFECMGAVKKEV